MRIILKKKKNDKISIQSLGKVEKMNSFYKLIKSKWKYRSVKNVLDYILYLIKSKDTVKNFEVEGNVIKITVAELDDKKREYKETAHTIEIDKNLMNENGFNNTLNNITREYNSCKQETLMNITKNEQTLRDYLDLNSETLLNKDIGSLNNIVKFLEKKNYKLANSNIVEISHGIFDKLYKLIPLSFMGISLLNFGNLFNDIFNYEFFNLKCFLLGISCPVLAYGAKKLHELIIISSKKDFIKGIVQICKKQINYRKSTSQDLLKSSKKMNSEKLLIKENDYFLKAIKDLLSALSVNPNERIRRKIFELKKDYIADRKNNNDFTEPVLTQEILNKRYSYLNKLLQIEMDIANNIPNKKKHLILKPFRRKELNNKLNFLGMNDDIIEYNRPILCCVQKIKETIFQHKENPNMNINKYCVESYQNIINYAYTLLDECIKLCNSEEFIKEVKTSEKGFAKAYSPVSIK